MADIESTAASVLEAERAVYGPIAEGHALIALFANATDMDAFGTLARNTIERFIEAFDAYHMELVTHGRAPNSPLAGVQPARLEPGEADA